MSLHRLLRAVLLLLATQMAGAVFAQTQTQAQIDYRAGKERISATFKADRSACVKLTGNTREVCLKEAMAERKTAQARLEFGSTDNPADEYRVLLATAQAQYAVARQRCMAQAGNARHVCIKQAKAIETHAIVDARANRKLVEVHRDATQEKRNAWYAVAAKKCDALLEEAKSHCIAAAKAQFGKS